MSSENPRNIMRSWSLQTGWATGPVREDKLVPPDYGRIRTPFLHTWREQVIDNNLNWDSQRFSIYLPESLRVVSGMYLKIEVPANSNSTAFKKYAGIYAMKEFKLLSAGQEVYTCNVQDFLVDYLESLSDEAVLRFSDTYLGHQATADDTARTVLIPSYCPTAPIWDGPGAPAGTVSSRASSGKTDWRSRLH